MRALVIEKRNSHWMFITLTRQKTTTTRTSMIPKPSADPNPVEIDVPDEEKLD